MSDVKDGDRKGQPALTPDQGQLEWRVAPAEPTPKMIKAGELAIRNYCVDELVCIVPDELAVLVYRAMTSCLQKESSSDFVDALAYDVRWELPFCEPATDTELAKAIKKTMLKFLEKLTGDVAQPERVDVTPEMIEAGANALLESGLVGDLCLADNALVEQIFRAMAACQEYRWHGLQDKR